MLEQIPRELAALRDYEALAQARLDPAVWAYFSGGAADERCLARNLLAYEQWTLKPRLLRDLTGGHTRLQLLGCSLEHPIMLAPVAYQALAHPQAELASALAAQVMGAGMVLSTQASTLLESVAEQSQAPLWFQLYIQPDRDFTLALIRRAEAAGYKALLITVDAPVSGVRNREQRAGFVLPAGVEAVNLRGMRSLVEPAGDGLLLGSALLQGAPTWRDIEWIKQQTDLPVLLKGVLSREDALLAHQLGVDGLVLSNHGGRILDGLPAAIEVLSEIREALPKPFVLLVDGGIRRGTDVLKALALGADAVLIGRPYIYALACAGALGVAHVLRTLRWELEVAMALTGRATLAELDASVLGR